GFAAAIQQAGIPFDTAVERITASAFLTHRSALRPHSFPPPHPASLRSQPSAVFRTEVNPGDRRRVREIVESTGFFTPAEVDVAVELVDERLSKADASGYFF